MVHSMASGLLFSGTNVLSLDDKGRIALPVKYRQLIKESCDGECYLAKSLFDECLWLYTKPQWDELVDSFTALNTVSQTALRSIQRTLLGSAVYCKLDAQGRILIPQELRRLCLLEKKATLIGINNKFEIWSETCLDRQRIKDAEVLQNLSDSAILNELASIAL